MLFVLFAFNPTSFLHRSGDTLRIDNVGDVALMMGGAVISWR